jgi:hypothetical protein
MGTLAAVAKRIEEIGDDVEDVLKDVEYCIPRDQLEQLLRQVEQEILRSSIAVFKALGKSIARLRAEAESCDEMRLQEIRVRLGQLCVKNEGEKRRIEIQLFGTSREQRTTTLQWMAEQGGKQELELLRQVKGLPAYSSGEIHELLQRAEERIRQRIDKPAVIPASREETTGIDLQRLAWDTFCKQLPNRLKTSAGQWVAFHGDHEVASGATKQEVYAQLTQKGFPLHEILVSRIEPLGSPVDIRQLAGKRGPRQE